MELSTDKRVDNLEEQFKTFEKMKDPSVLFHEMHRMCQIVEENITKIIMLENKLKEHEDSHDVIVIEDELLRETWKKSGVKLKELNILLKLDPNNLSMTSKLVNGSIKDVSMRYKVYKYCLERIKENEKENEKEE